MTFHVAWTPRSRSKVKYCIFFVNASHKFLEVADEDGSSNFKFCLCIGHMMARVLGNTSCDFDLLGIKVK